MREPFADYTRPPAPWERSQMPPAEQPTEILQRLEPLLQGARLLVDNGLTWLRWAWDGLPPIKVRLLRTGEALDAELQTPAQARIPDLTVRGCGWYIEVQLLRAEAHGSERSPDESRFLQRLKDLIPRLNGHGTGDTGDNGDEPDPPLWVTIIRDLVDAVSRLGNTQADMQADMSDMKSVDTAIQSDIADMQSDIAGIKDMLQEHPAAFARIEGHVDRIDGHLENLDGRQGRIDGLWYEDRFKDTLHNNIYNICARHADITFPQSVELLWTDRKEDQPRDEFGKRIYWDQVCRNLNLPVEWDSPLQDCGFLVRVTWKEQPQSLLLVGEISQTVDTRVLKKIESHRRTLAAARHTVLAVIVGARFMRGVTDGPDRVRKAGAVWLERPRDRKSEDWRKTTDMAQDFLKAYYRLGGEAN